MIHKLKFEDTYIDLRRGTMNGSSVKYRLLFNK